MGAAILIFIGVTLLGGPKLTARLLTKHPYTLFSFEPLVVSEQLVHLAWVKDRGLTWWKQPIGVVEHDGGWEINTRLALCCFCLTLLMVVHKAFFTILARLLRPLPLLSCSALIAKHKVIAKRVFGQKFTKV